MSNNYLSFDLVGFPTGKINADKWSGNGTQGILIVVSETELLAKDQEFLENVLAAAKLTPIAEKVILLHCQPEESVDLSSFCRQHDLHTVFIFGHALPLLGIRAQLSWYEFTRLGELSLLRAHALSNIRQDRQQQKNEKAGALWKALKAKYL